MGIAFVGHQPDIFRAADFVDLGKLIGRHDGAAGIARRIDDQQLGPRRDGARNLLGAQPEAVGRIGHHGHRSRAGVQDHVRIADPVRRGNEHFIAGAEQRAKRVEDGVFAAHRHDALRHRVGRAELRRVPLADGFTQRADSPYRGVFRSALFEGANGSALDVLRRREVRFARPKIGQVNALGAQAFRRRKHSGSRRDRNAVNTGSKLHGIRLLQI